MSILTACIAGVVLFVALVAASTVHYREEKKRDNAFKKSMDEADTITKRAQDLTKRFEEGKKSWK